MIQNKRCTKQFMSLLMHKNEGARLILNMVYCAKPDQRKNEKTRSQGYIRVSRKNILSAAHVTRQS